LFDELEDPQKPANKYEMVIVAAREARRENDLARGSGQKPERKVTLTAVDKVVKGQVKFQYEEEPQEPEEKETKPSSRKKKG
jgi:DNA-directed RNA polymerase subunit K/omega